ncbi:MAG: hypothetical protein ACRCU2_14865, partial [Planktothrix sp.]
MTVHLISVSPNHYPTRPQMRSPPEITVSPETYPIRSQLRSPRPNYLPNCQTRQFAGEDDQMRSPPARLDPGAVLPNGLTRQFTDIDPQAIASQIC